MYIDVMKICFFYGLYENVCVDIFNVFFYPVLRVWKTMCIFAADFEIILYDRKTQLVLWAII